MTSDSIEGAIISVVRWVKLGVEVFGAADFQGKVLSTRSESSNDD